MDLSRLKVLHEKKPYRCPVCGGRGLVHRGFYGDDEGGSYINVGQYELCRSCKGDGIVFGLVVYAYIGGDSDGSQKEEGG